MCSLLSCHPSVVWVTVRSLNTSEVVHLASCRVPSRRGGSSTMAPAAPGTKLTTGTGARMSTAGFGTLWRRRNTAAGASSRRRPSSFGRATCLGRNTCASARNICENRTRRSRRSAPGRRLGGSKHANSPPLQRSQTAARSRSMRSGDACGGDELERHRLAE